MLIYSATKKIDLLISTMMIDYNKIIDMYYPEAGRLRDILITHSQLVMQRALAVCKAHPGLGADCGFVEGAAMLHDIGIFKCDAPGIACFGTEPYICHGIIGGKLLRELGKTTAHDYEAYARVCERHTGAGISREEIERQHLPLPLRDFLPETIEEQIICYADKFYSKSHPDREKTYEQAEHSLERFGADGLNRFRRWHQMFEG